MILFKLLKNLFKFIVLLFSFIAIYFFTAYIFMFFPSISTVNNSKNQKIYILYNDFHSDIILDLKNCQQPWNKHLPSLVNKKEGFITFGWGDKETYLNTPTFNDLKITTALKALFLNTSSLMHVGYYKNIKVFNKIKSIQITKEEHSKLEENILKSFNLKEKSYSGYGRNDYFYNSPKSYNLFNTCNTWTGEKLRHANVPMSYWTPLSANVVHSLP